MAEVTRTSESVKRHVVGYVRAPRDQPSQIWLLARWDEDECRLIQLGNANVGTKEREIYLLGKGFTAAEPVASSDIAREYSMPSTEMDTVIPFVDAEMSN